MPIIKLNADGSITAKRSQAETIEYYDEQMEKRLQAMLKLQALGADITAIRNKIQQLSTEKKKKIVEVG